jgi:hypothetical protein
MWVMGHEQIESKRERERERKETERDRKMNRKRERKILAYSSSQVNQHRW